MNTVIQMLEREIQNKQKSLHQWQIMPVAKSRPEKILRKIAELKTVLRLLKQQWHKTEKKKSILK